MRSFLFVAGLFSVSLVFSVVHSGNACTQGSQDMGSGDCRPFRPTYRLFRSDGFGVRTCPYGSTYVGNGYCRSK